MRLFGHRYGCRAGRDALQPPRWHPVPAEEVEIALVTSECDASLKNGDGFDRCARMSATPYITQSMKLLESFANAK